MGRRYHDRADRPRWTANVCTRRGSGRSRAGLRPTPASRLAEPYPRGEKTMVKPLRRSGRRRWLEDGCDFPTKTCRSICVAGITTPPAGARNIKPGTINATRLGNVFHQYSWPNGPARSTILLARHEHGTNRPVLVPEYVSRSLGWPGTARLVFLFFTFYSYFTFFIFYRYF